MNSTMVIDYAYHLCGDEDFPSKTRQFFNNVQFLEVPEKIKKRMKTLFEIFEMKDSYYVSCELSPEPRSYEVELSSLDLMKTSESLQENGFEILFVSPRDTTILVTILDKWIRKQ